MNLVALGALTCAAMKAPSPRQAIRMVGRLAQSLRRDRKTTKEDVSVASANGLSSEVCVLDDSFAPSYDADDRETRKHKRGLLQRLEGARRAFALRRRQVAGWKDQAADVAVKTLRDYYALVSEELEGWQSRSRESSCEERDSGGTSSQHVSEQSRASCRTSSSHSVASGSSSFSSVTDSEEDRRKQLRRKEFSLPRRSDRGERRSVYGFVETNRGRRQRLLLVRALPLNDSDDEDVDESSTLRHLPFRTITVDGEPYILSNEWV